MVEVRRVRGDDPEARALVAAMEAWVTENFGPHDARPHLDGDGRARWRRPTAPS